jgi:WD40 repeat protein
VYALDPGDATITSQAWSPDGNRVALAFEEGSLQVYEMADLKNPAWVLPSQDETILDLGWAPNSQRIATAEGGGAVRIWDLASQGEISTLHVPGEARSVDWSPVGDQVIITSSLGTFSFIHRAWLSTEEQVRAAYQCCVERDLTPEERARFGLQAK